MSVWTKREAVAQLGVRGTIFFGRDWSDRNQNVLPINNLRHRCIQRQPSNTPRVVPTDPDDDHVIAAAVTGQADLIASGDKRDLLPLGSYAGIPIVTAREAVERLEARAEE